VYLSVWVGVSVGVCMCIYICDSFNIAVIPEVYLCVITIERFVCVCVCVCVCVFVYVCEWD